jgi:ABC-type polysaccharide/polyol phosphate export permease
VTLIEQLNPFRVLRPRHVALLREVAVTEHRLRDQSTSLGFVWSFLHPIVMLLVLYVFFQGRVGEGIPHYGIFLLIGIVQYTHFSKSTGGAMRVLHQMRGLATNVIFPKDVLIYSVVLSDAPEFLISMLVTVLIALLTGVPASWAMLAIPLVVLLQMLFVLWISLALAPLYVFVRDLDHLYEVAMRVLFFVTPIMYNLDFVGPTARRIALLNPLTHLLDFSRIAILEGRFPPLTSVAAFLLGNLALGYLSLLVFRRVESSLVEQL